jgi:hypothetical protein
MNINKQFHRLQVTRCMLHGSGSSSHLYKIPLLLVLVLVLVLEVELELEHHILYIRDRAMKSERISR